MGAKQRCCHSRHQGRPKPPACCVGEEVWRHFFSQLPHDGKHNCPNVKMILGLAGAWLLPPTLASAWKLQKDKNEVALKGTTIIGLWWEEPQSSRGFQNSTSWGWHFLNMCSVDAPRVAVPTLLLITLARSCCTAWMSSFHLDTTNSFTRAHASCIRSSCSTFTLAEARFWAFLDWSIEKFTGSRARCMYVLAWCSKTAAGGTRPKWIRGGSSMSMSMDGSSSLVGDHRQRKLLDLDYEKRFNLGDDGSSNLHGIATGGRSSERGCCRSARHSTKLTSAASGPPACHTEEVWRCSASQLQRGRHGCP